MFVVAVIIVHYDLFMIIILYMCHFFLHRSQTLLGVTADIYS